MRYVCQICGYIYDDAKEKIPFAELPDTWRCPLCGAAKSNFRPEEVKEDVKPVAIQTVNADLKELYNEKKGVKKMKTYKCKVCGEVFQVEDRA